MSTLILTFLFGLFLGFKHSLEADHLTAVLTLSTQHKNSFRAALIGTFWGVGHTTTLFIVGLAVLLLKINIPTRVQLLLELVVGVMLVSLGIRAFFKREIIHEHLHQHDGHEHTHMHTDHSHRHRQSFFVGAVHGLAGSGALMVLVLSTFHTVIEGIVYILLFGLGSIFGMTVMSFLIGLPFTYAKSKLARFNNLEHTLQRTAGVLSIIIGLGIVYEISIINHLFF